MIVIWFYQNLEDTGFGHWCSVQMVRWNLFMCSHLQVCRLTPCLLAVTDSREISCTCPSVRQAYLSNALALKWRFHANFEVPSVPRGSWEVVHKDSRKMEGSQFVVFLFQILMEHQFNGLPSINLGSTRDEDVSNCKLSWIRFTSMLNGSALSLVKGLDMDQSNCYQLALLLWMLKGKFVMLT